MALFGTMGGLQTGLAAALSAPGTMSEAKVPTQPRRRGGGLFGGLRRAFDPSNIAMTQAILNGDYGTAAQIQAQQQRARAAQAEVEAEQAQRQSLFSNLVKQGMDPGTAELVMTNPEAFGTEFNTRFRTREAGASGGSTTTPGLNGVATTTMAPSRHEFQGSVFDVPGGPGPAVLRRPGHQIVPLQPGGEAAVFNSYTGEEITGPAGAPPLTVPPPAAQGGQVGPPPGAVVNGYRFRGGNPNDRNNWEPVAQGGAGPSGPRNFR